MKKIPIYFTTVLIASLFLWACETDDIEPEIKVSLSLTDIAIAEGTGPTEIVATLNSAANTVVNVQLSTAGTAIENVDYTLSSGTISIPAGSTEGRINLTVIQDTLQEGTETVEVTAVSADGANIDGTQTLSIPIEDDDVAATAQFIINELLYDPSNNALNGDANGDSLYSQDNDSFIEFYNPSSRDFDLSGYEIWDDTTSGGTNQFTFPQGTIIKSNSALVVFGGGTPTGNFGGATVLNAMNGLNFNNSGEVIGIKDPNGKYFLIFDSDVLSGNPNESYTRNPDITGDFEQHSDNTPLLFSPGTKIDGSPF